MAELKVLMGYLISNYPRPDQISNARLTKMVYLCDWKSSLRQEKQITSIEWYYDNYGPYVPEVLQTAKNNPDVFAIETTTNLFGTGKTLIKLITPYTPEKMLPIEVEVANHVIEKTKNKNYSEFIQLIYSTYPIVKSEQFSSLNLPALAKEYRIECLS